MHVITMNGQMAEFFQEATIQSSKKNLDYHPDKVAMLEILRTACETETSPEKDLWGRIRKQMSAIKRQVMDGHLESEPIDSRLRDVAVYMAILDFWIKNRKECIHDAAEFMRTQPCDKADSRTGIVKTCFDSSDVERCDRCEFLRWLVAYDLTS